MAKAIDEGEIAAVGAHLHPDFTAADLAKDAFLEAVAAALSRYRVDNPRLRSFQIEFPAPGEAVATFSASCRVRTPRSYGHIPSRWRAYFRQDASQWRLTGLQALPVPPLHVSDLRQWLR